MEQRKSLALEFYETDKIRAEPVLALWLDLGTSEERSRGGDSCGTRHPSRHSGSGGCSAGS